MRPGRATSTAAPATRPGTPCRSAWPRSRAAAAGWPSPAAWQPRTPCCGRCAGPATTWSSPTTRTAARTGSSPRSPSAGDWTGRPRPLADLDAVRAAFRPGHTKLIWVETPTNPLLNIADIAALAGPGPRVRRAAGRSTTRSRRRTCSSRIAHGADVVVHSTTKYVGGHSDVVGGALIAANDGARRGAGVPPERDGRDQRPVRRLARPCAASRPSGVRMDRHCDNAERIVRLPRRAPGGGPGALPGAGLAPGSRGRREADAPVRRDDLLPGRRRP